MNIVRVESIGLFSFRVLSMRVAIDIFSLDRHRMREGESESSFYLTTLFFIRCSRTLWTRTCSFDLSGRKQSTIECWLLFEVVCLIYHRLLQCCCCYTLLVIVELPSGIGKHSAIRNALLLLLFQEDHWDRQQQKRRSTEREKNDARNRHREQHSFIERASIASIACLNVLLWQHVEIPCS